MEYIKIDLEKQIRWYFIYTMLKNAYPNSSISDIIDTTNDIVRL